MKKKMYLFLIVLFTSFASLMAQIKVSGIVTDVDGAGIPGVSILQKGTSRQTKSREREHLR